MRLRSRVLGIIFVLFLNVGFWTKYSCNAQEIVPTWASGFYKPQEFIDMDFTDKNSRWCFERSKTSEHFILFWEKEFGNDPGSLILPANMRVDTDDLLKKAEQFYCTNTETLGFGKKLEEKSWLDTYKMEIYLLYQEEWIAVGSGYDNTIGALWVNPTVCQPVGATIAHEIGHCFQYQIYCDQLLNGMEDKEQTGFRYCYGNGLGNTFWEQCAEWQAWQDYPAEAFTWYYKDTWTQNCNRAIENEWTRYQNYWFLYAVSELYGRKAIGNIWHLAQYPEDVLAAYSRIYCGNDLERLADDLYFYASHAATWDFPDVCVYADEWIGSYTTELYPDRDGFQQISYADCPDEGGFNVIACDPGQFGKTITVIFRSLEEGTALASEDPGIYHRGEDGVDIGGTVSSYNLPDGIDAEMGILHRYGFVALTGSGERIYGECHKEQNEEVSFSIPEDTRELYFVVVGTPQKHVAHCWDNDERTDRQLPYRVKFF